MSLLDKDFPSLAAMPPQLAAAKLRAVGENDAADALERAAATSQPEAANVFGVRELLGRFNKPWQQSGTAIGYLAPVPDTSSDSIPIISARRIEADATLKDAALKITLDRFYVAQYPGGGKHRILLHFATQIQAQKRTETETLHFNTTCDVLDGQIAAIENYPIFTGFTVGNEGLTFEYTTINVKNEQDQGILDLLNTDVFRNGVKLVAMFQPVLAPFSAIAVALAKMFCNRNNNINIGPFKMGLDFSTIPSHNRLAEGSYIVTQLPEDLQRTWNWSNWAYRIDSGLIIKKADSEQRIPYNYLIFSITRYQE
jgi:hypothetical protein